jgi:archaellum component FlaF (FlaF/FlaG flagellin family)
VTDSVSGGLATEFTPGDLKKETSITNVHSILYWMDKNNPTIKNSGQTNDSQYKNWEYGVEVWWQANKYKYPVVTEANIPKTYDSIHTAELKPSFEILGIENKTYSKQETVNISINSTSTYPIKKIDVFVNNTYLTSLKTYPFITSFIPNNISDISNTNIVRVVGVDGVGNIGENSFSFNVSK